MLALVLPSFARFCIAMKLGIAIAARMPMITTTIISSISVKPFSALFMVLTPPRRLVAIVATASVMIVVQPICRWRAHGDSGVGPAVTLAASGLRVPGARFVRSQNAACGHFALLRLLGDGCGTAQAAAGRPENATRVGESGPRSEVLRLGTTGPS